MWSIILSAVGGFNLAMALWNAQVGNELIAVAAASGVLVLSVAVWRVRLGIAS